VRPAIGLALLPLLLAPLGARAQSPAVPTQPAAPQPILRTSIDPPRVLVGAKDDTSP